MRYTQVICEDCARAHKVVDYLEVRLLLCPCEALIMWIPPTDRPMSVDAALRFNSIQEYEEHCPAILRDYYE